MFRSSFLNKCSSIISRSLFRLTTLNVPFESIDVTRTMRRHKHVLYNVHTHTRHRHRIEHTQDRTQQSIGIR